MAHAEPFTLAQALALAYETNPQLQAQRAAVRATDEEVAKAYGGWRPKATVDSSYAYARGEYHAIPGPAAGTYPRGVTATVSQPLFGGDLLPNIRKARAMVESSREQLRSTEEQVLLDGATAYLDVLRFQRIVDLEQASIEDLQKLRDMVQTRVDVGELSRTELGQTEGRMYSVMDNLTAAQTQLAGARAAFEHAIGRPAENLVNPPFPVVQDDVETAVNLAMNNNPTVLYARDQTLVAEHAVNAAKGALAPRVSVQGQYERSRDLVATGIGINDFAVTAQLHVPLYQGGAEYAQVRESKQQATQTRYNAADAERQVRQQLRVSIDTLRNARAAIPLNEKQVEATHVAFVGAQAETIIGERSTLEVLINEEDYVNAQTSLLTARRNAYVAAFQVLAGTGDLTAIGLHLPVKLYDPTVHYREDAARWFGFGDSSARERGALISAAAAPIEPADANVADSEPRANSEQTLRIEPTVTSKPSAAQASAVNVEDLLSRGMALSSTGGDPAAPKSKLRR
ncbi:MAG: TolC family outer membrane protein [Sphingomicrobium sp.]